MSEEKHPEKIGLRRAFEERNASFPYENVCTECGKDGCKSFWHLLKHATTRSANELTDKHRLVNGLVSLVLLLVAMLVYFVFGRY